MPKPNRNESKQDYLKRCTTALVDTEGKKPDQAYAMCNAYWDDAHKKKAESKPITLAGSVTLELAKGDGSVEASDTFLMTGYTGKVIDLGWFGRYMFDLSGIKAKSKIPILREHRRDRVVGWSLKSWVDGSNFLISGQFSESTRDAKEVLALAREGYPWQASVGISPRKIKRLADEKETAEVNGQTVSGPIEIWLESQVGEVSFVSLGADSDTAAISMADQGVAITCDLIEDGAIVAEEGGTMTLDELKTKHPELYQEAVTAGAASVDLKATETAGIEAERKRVAEIMAAGGDPEVTKKAIADGLSLDAAYKLFFEAEKSQRARGLTELAAAAPTSLGHQSPVDPNPVTDGNVEETIQAKAIALSLEEKIDLAVATKRILSLNPELARKYRATFDA